MPSFIGYVPTPSHHIDAFFALAPVSSQDVVCDLGSGDGRLLIAAIEAGAGQAIGIELDPDNVRKSLDNIKVKGLEDRVKVIHADVLDVDLSRATVVLCYLIPKASEEQGPKFERELQPGARVVMESFPVPGWKEDATLKREYKQFYLYTMPPKHKKGG
jgi:ribosomal protein L11 methylase PrmA